MLSIVIPAWGEEPALLDTLASLVHATAEGVVRDVALATPEANQFLRTVADSAGCELVEGPNDRGALVSLVAGRMKSAWIFVVEQGFAPGGDWMADVADFVAREETAQPPAKTRHAALTLVPNRGWGVAERFVNLQTDLFGKSWPPQGLIAQRDGFALPPSGRVVRLRSPMYNRHRGA
jgi:hypothetical protein